MGKRREPWFIEASPYGNPFWRGAYPEYTFPNESKKPPATPDDRVYQAPNLSQIVGFKPLKWVTDNWELSGVTQIKSNIRTAYPTVNFSNTNSTDLSLPNATGTSGEGARLLLVGNPNLPSDQVSFKGGSTTSNIGVNGTPGNALFNNAAFQIPLPCSLTPQANPRLGIGQDMSCFGNAGAGQLPAEGSRGFVQGRATSVIGPDLASFDCIAATNAG